VALAPSPEPGDGDGGRASGRAAADARPYRLVNPALLARAEEDAPPEPVIGTDTMKIGIWGPPGSGKTTYLAALKHDAASRARDEIGTWKIIPRNEASEQLLTQWTQLLVERQEFPEATPLGSHTDLWWHFMGDLAGSRYARRRLGIFGRPALTSKFDLELIDVSGEAFGYRPTDAHVPENLVRRTLAHLAGSDGLIFLFDPITERDTPSVATYVERVLNNLSRRVLNAGRMADGYLPHQVAICVAKTDNVELVAQARKAGLVNTGHDGIDRVLNGQAEALFNAICDGGFWESDERRHGGAAYVRNQLSTYFHPGRTRYYAISAIGHQNLATRNGVVKINGPIRPFNVLEPLVELHMQLRNQA
jgi:GTPase SAR1 family protein